MAFFFSSIIIKCIIHGGNSSRYYLHIFIGRISTDGGHSFIFVRTHIHSYNIHDIEICTESNFLYPLLRYDISINSLCNCIVQNNNDIYRLVVRFFSISSDCNEKNPIIVEDIGEKYNTIY